MIEWTAACSAGGDNGRRFHPRLFAEGVCEDGRRDESGGQADELHQHLSDAPVSSSVEMKFSETVIFIQRLFLSLGAVRYSVVFVVENEGEGNTSRLHRIASHQPCADLRL